MEGGCRIGPYQSRAQEEGRQEGLSIRTGLSSRYSIIMGTPGRACIPQDLPGDLMTDFLEVRIRDHSIRITYPNSSRLAWVWATWKRIRYTYAPVASTLPLFLLLPSHPSLGSVVLKISCPQRS